MNEPSNQPHSPEPAASAEMSPFQRILKLILALLFLVIALFGGSAAGNKVSEALGESDAILTWGTLVTVLVRSILAVAGFLLLGAKGWFRPNKDKLLKAVWFALPMLIVNTALGGLVIESIFIPKDLGGDGGEFASGSIGNAAFSLLLMLLVGINEEVIFRGLGFGGLLLGFGHKKNGILTAAVISSLVFGFAHIMFEINLSNAVTLLIGALKMLQTAMMALVLCYTVLSQRDLCGAIAVHAFFDWIIMIGALLKPEEYNVDYVATESPIPQLSDTAMMVVQCGFYLFVMVLYLPRTLKAIRLLRTMQPDSGPFTGADAEKTAERTA